MREPARRTAPPGGTPQYRSPEWHVLPEDDPRRLRAVYLAADCWHAHWSDEEVARRLAEELAFVDHEVRRRFREMSWDLSTAATWSALADEPPHAELARRLAALPAEPCGSPTCRGCSACIRADWVARHGGDYPGQP
jgi:hypothetical protein